jgi:23S rRNA (adenine2030-N6)-methyltransferase
MPPSALAHPFMNYQHAYHAGNFADVTKHSLLALLLQFLQKKETPYCYIDTHAGAGCYDLSSVPVQKTGEYRSGIQRLLDHRGKHPAVLMPYLNLLQQPNYCTDGRITHYPGSPEIAEKLRRPQDRLIFNEFHPHVHQVLKHHFARHHDLSVHHRDAYEFLPAILPPKEKRGVVLIDPPFEKQTEFQAINTCLHKALLRWPNGVYMIWSPITGHTHPNPGAVALRHIEQPILQLDFTISPIIPKLSGLVGCRFWVINPPFQFEAQARELLQYLKPILKMQ